MDWTVEGKVQSWKIEYVVIVWMDALSSRGAHNNVDVNLRKFLMYEYWKNQTVTSIQERREYLIILNVLY